MVPPRRVVRGASTEEAIAHGIRSAAGVVTSAATVMVSVFAIFATLSMLFFKQFGVGLATAVLLDATIVRAVLLPATMKLLGDWNWYLPRWLEWLPQSERPTPRPHRRSGRGPSPRRSGSGPRPCTGRDPSATRAPSGSAAVTGNPPLTAGSGTGATGLSPPLGTPSRSGTERMRLERVRVAGFRRA